MQLLPLVPVLEDRFFITQGIEYLPANDGFRFFEPRECIKYEPFCDDFGPMNMACVTNFVDQLESELSEHSESIFFYKVEEGRRNLTNALFLVGAYMIIKLQMDVSAVTRRLKVISRTLTEAFRDATYSNVDFELTLEDCWAGLAKGMQLEWIKYAPSFDHLWGTIDIREYSHYDDPINGDLHEVVPGKFIAFTGPHDLGGLSYHDDEHGRRRFSPAHYADIFQDFGVKHVVRLNEPQYDAQDFEDYGICHHSLEFEDCTPPPAEVVDAFFAIVDQAQDAAVAVHCKAGLGRTGTLIALYLMRTHGFSAREAMGWLRIMRPGSVIGEQQHCLCEVEAAGGDYRAAVGRSSSSDLLRARSDSDQVAEGLEQRNASRSPAAWGLK